MTLAAIPSPTVSVWHVFGFPIRAYALCIVLGIVVAVLVMEVRLRRRGVAPWASLDMAVWAVPFGIVGARIYHVITSPQDYFGAGGSPIQAFYIWEGGLGIWGAVAGGAVGAWIAARQLGLPLSVFADALAPGLPLAQAIGRFGNWFNNELYGSVTTLPWGLRVHDMDRSNPGRATLIDGKPVTLPDLYHPTFLYEAVWNVGVAGLVFLLDRRFKFGRGRAFALYVMAYTVGRCWIEMLRVDDASHFFGIRLNVFTSIVVFLGALAYFLLVKGPREYVVPIDAPDSAPEPAAGDIGQVDVTESAEPDRAKAPRAYQVVSEERFRAYERTGILPPEDAPAVAPSGASPGETPSSAAAAAGPDSSQPPAAPGGDQSSTAGSGRNSAAPDSATGDGTQPAGSSAGPTDER
ncbi:prolipoprotein diacylglyceryl transferase [Krasilnikovia cinnamomea]|uniref:Phosphatidylglycerol--prolipoprotein diacylglyceryl transferase n=1 Tax=Krasilnikovia cinnamomea TaxID=349313 RepID=A0A4Q7ZRB5_9ACTN|nr:prolipoprotein diacylglyceryl transferase [Krasilnikovia cinnamomea]RZU53015.1 prolipoprotein diacylglyceryl transferase [Krasilnikovia cinnamomea]